jgi:hypothetical protein
LEERVPSLSSSASWKTLATAAASRPDFCRIASAASRVRKLCACALMYNMCVNMCEHMCVEGGWKNDLGKILDGIAVVLLESHVEAVVFERGGGDRT